SFDPSLLPRFASRRDRGYYWRASGHSQISSQSRHRRPATAHQVIGGIDLVDRFIRSKMREALDVEQPDPALRARVMASLPVIERPAGRLRRPSIEWAGGVIAGFLTLAVVVSLMYVRGGLFPSTGSIPYERSRSASGMVSPTTGWAFSEASGYLIRTADGGRHWVDV